MTDIEEIVEIATNGLADTDCLAAAEQMEQAALMIRRICAAATCNSTDRQLVLHLEQHLN